MHAYMSSTVSTITIRKALLAARLVKTQSKARTIPPSRRDVMAASRTREAGSAAFSCKWLAGGGAIGQ